MDIVSHETVTLVALIARAIRDELGEEIDAYPAGRDPDQADPMNRAFRALVAALVARDGTTTPTTVSHVLRRVAAERLAADGFAIQGALDEEPGSPDDWLAFLILSSRRQVADALQRDDDTH
jgi:hypothetical protein